MQTIPQQASTTITLLQRPASSSSALTSTSSPHPVFQSQSQPQQSFDQYPQMARNQQSSSRNSASYRGSTVQPVAPYAFTSTPSLSNSGPQSRQSASPFLKLEDRTLSAPSSQQAQAHSNNYGSIPPRLHHSTAGSVSSSSSSSMLSHGSKDDSAILPRQYATGNTIRPVSMIGFTPPSLPPQSSNPSKPSPDRYRRGQRLVSQTQNPASTLASAQGNHNNSNNNSNNTKNSNPAVPTTLFEGNPFSLSLNEGGITAHHTRGASADDARFDKTQPAEPAKRYRRRSLGSLDISSPMDYSTHQISQNAVSNPPKIDMPSTDLSATRPSSHGRGGSSDSNSSRRSSTASVSYIYFLSFYTLFYI